MHTLKPTLKTELAPILVIILMAAASLYFYSAFPERVPTHWNFAGEPDGWSSRALGAFLLPAITAALYLFFFALPVIDPNRERYAEFRRPYHVFKALIITLLAAVYGTASLAALGVGISVGTVVPVAVGLMLMLLGNYFGKLRPNWFVGLRTPWTLSSEEVWNRTHRLGGKFFVAGGAAIAIDAFLPTAAKAPVFIASIVAMVAVPIVYSYVLYRRFGRGLSR